MHISLYNLTKDQVFILKGIGITLIVLHNFIHLLSGTAENQMNFSIDKFQSFLIAIVNNPLAIFNNTLSYFGHFGVQVFVFCSAFGLTKKYIANKSINYWNFIIARTVKLFSLLLLGIIFYLLILALKNELTPILAIKIFITKTWMLDNLSYYTIYRYIGPWWFFSLILQLYSIFPLLLFIIKKYGKSGFLISMIASYVLIYALFPVAEKNSIPLFGNFIGHLPEFLLGIGIAYFKEWKLDGKTILIALLVFIASNLHEYIFPLSFISATIVLLFTSKSIIKSSGRITKSLLFAGRISMFAFIINGIIRFFIYPFLDQSNPLSITGFSLMHLAIVFAVSFLLKLIYDKTLYLWSKRLIAKTAD